MEEKAMKKGLIFTVIFTIVTSFLIVNICRADDIDDTVFTTAKFQVKQTFNIPDGIRVTIHARKPLDIDGMLEDIKYDGSETMDSVEQKIEAKRTSLFPNEEIILAVTDEKTPDRAAIAAGITRIKIIAWWNNVNSKGSYWYAYYTSQAADLFIYVISGSYSVYYNVGGTYTPLFVLLAGQGGEWSTYGTSKTRGYKGTGKSSSNKADIVMNFYNSY
jgi:hypothetical protein